jgi:hypothetical protein
MFFYDKKKTREREREISRVIFDLFFSKLQSLLSSFGIKGKFFFEKSGIKML